MRVFLIGMCDLFLLLYLTALSQGEGPRASTLTVADYKLLQASKVDLEQNTSALQRALEEAQAAKGETEKKLRTVQEGLEGEKREREAALEKASENAKLLATAQATAANIEEQARTRAEEAREEAERATHALELASAEREKLRAESAEREKSLQERATETEKLLDEARRAEAQRAQELLLTKRLAEEAEARARKLTEEVNEAKNEAQQARREGAEATEVALAAKANEARALALAEGEARRAASSEADAERSKREARRAAEEAAVTRERIITITQTTARAYRERIKPLLTTLRLQYESGGGLLGERERTLMITGVPVQFGDERVVFVPLEQIGIRPSSLKAKPFPVKGSAEGRPITKVYLSNNKPHVLAFVLVGGKAAPNTRARNIESLMPTLLAIRNGTPLGFGDQFRDVDEKYYPFSRDRLQSSALDQFIYETEGFRGTGDYAEYIVAGDQIVDLDGTFIGIASRDNTVEQVGSLEGWTVLAAL